MLQSYDVYFASSNRNKFFEVRKILNEFNINVGFYKCSLQEIQSNSLEKIASQKIDDAFAQCKKPVLIEDDGLFINSLKGFPGPYSSYVYETIGNDGVIELLNSKRNASFFSIIAYCDSSTKKFFKGKIDGKISRKIKGNGWGYDPIFIPLGKTKTFAEIKDKNKISHRFKALKKFANWFQNN